MITPKILLYKHKTYSDGTNPIILQVVKDGKPIRKVIGKCLATEWLKSNRVSSKNIRHHVINNDIEYALKNYGMTKKESFVDFYTRHIVAAKQRQQYAVYTINKRVLDQLIEFNPKLDFDTIDEKFLMSFAAHIKGNNKTNTVRTKMQHFGKILKEALKEDLISRNPMQYLTFKKEKTIKSKLSLTELKKIMDLDLKGMTKEIRDLFMACVYMRGVRVGDALSLMDSNIKNGRVVYKESKTGKIVNIAIVPELQEIFDNYKGKNRYGFIFTLLRTPAEKLQDNFFKKGEITRAICRINYNLGKIAKLANIDKKVSSHTARHSFSVLARNTIQDTTITMDLVGHSTLAVHENYISEISDNLEMDKYAEQVLNNLKPS